MFDIETYMRDPEVRRQAWANRRENPSWTAEPNRGHHALAELQRSGHLDTLLTQNIDGLHQRAGSTGVLELHGTIWEVACLSCGGRWPTPEVLARPEPDPPCLLCGGILKTATISFGQSLDADVLDAAFTRRRPGPTCSWRSGRRCRSTRSPASPAWRGTLAIVNAEPTPYDDDAEVVVRDSISDVLDEVRRSLA